MKKVIFIIVLVLLIKPILPVIEYATNYDYISTVLCENKDKPVLHCNGKCHLMKELAKASESEKPISNNKKVAAQLEEVLFFQEIKSFKTNTVAALDKMQSNLNYSNLYTSLNSGSVFRPPIFIS